MRIKFIANYIISFCGNFKIILDSLFFKEYDVVFYSKEFFHDDWIVSSLRNINKKKLHVLYIYSFSTSIKDKEGVAIIKLPERALSHIKTDILITAVSGIPRDVVSSNIRELVHMPHSFVSLHMVYAKDTFDAYNTIFSCGPHHDKEIEMINKVRGLKIKSVPIGYGRLDHYLLKTECDLICREERKVLIAPSWASGNIIDNIAIDLIHSLIECNYDVYLRPHPQHWRHFSSQLRGIVNIFNNSDKFHLNTQDDSGPLFACDILITDYSGISFDFYFIRSRPIIFVNSPLKSNNSEIDLYSINPIELSIRDEIGVISSHTIDDILEKVNNRDFKEFSIERLLYNYGGCSLAVNNYIENRIKG
jgi:hypothetical protein